MSRAPLSTPLPAERIAKLEGALEQVLYVLSRHYRRSPDVQVLAEAERLLAESKALG